MPQVALVNQGPQSGPLTPAYGDLVQTPRGLASIALEGFSEDLDQDGFVDPVVQAALPVSAPVPVAPVAAASFRTPLYASNFAAAPVAVGNPLYTSNFAAAAIGNPLFTSNFAFNPAVFGSAAPVAATAPASFGVAGNVYRYPAGAGCVNTWGAAVPCAL